MAPGAVLLKRQAEAGGWRPSSCPSDRTARRHVSPSLPGALGDSLLLSLPSPIPRLLPEVTSQTNYWLSNPVSGSTSGRSQMKILCLCVKESSLEGALASICDTPLLSEGVTEAPEEKLPSGELQLSPPLPQVLGRQPLSPRGPASSQEQGLAGEARVQGEHRGEGTHTGLFLGYGSLPQTKGPRGRGPVERTAESGRPPPSAPQDPPYFVTKPKPSARPPPPHGSL